MNLLTEIIYFGALAVFFGIVIFLYDVIVGRYSEEEEEMQDDSFKNN